MSRKNRVKWYKRDLPSVVFWLVILWILTCGAAKIHALQNQQAVPADPTPVETVVAGVSYTITPVPVATEAPVMTQEEAEEALVQAVLSVDHVAGMAIDCNGITYLDLLLLSRLIAAETGPEWPDSPAMAVGEVALNRVASPEFPDTLEEVLYQKGQYEPVLKESWADLRPTEHTIRLALRLLKGERVLNDPRVVFQCLTEIPTKTIMTYYDVNLDTTTYFCWTNHPELYN